jgi:hypothetical protein
MFHVEACAIPGRLLSGRHVDCARNSMLGDDLDSSFPDCLDECPVVTLALIGLLYRELANRVVKRRIRAEVSCYPGRVTDPA